MSSPLKADGFEPAFVGVAMQCCNRPDLMVYDYDKAVELLQTRDGMTWEEAAEYLDFNVLGAWMGEGTPIFMRFCTLPEALNHLEEQNGND